MSYPTTRAGFYGWVNRAWPYTQTNGARLGISPTDISDTGDIIGDDSTPGTYIFDAVKYNAASKRPTGDLVDNLDTSTEAVKKQFSKILDNSIAAKWNNADRNMYMRKKGLERSYSRPEEAIKEECDVFITPLSNQKFEFGAKPVGTVGRKHIPEGADGIEMAYAYVQNSLRKAADNPTKVMESCSGVDQTILKEIYYKALFDFQVVSVLRGYDIYFYFRFINTTYPDLAGPWSEVQIKTIL